MKTPFANDFNGIIPQSVKNVKRWCENVTHNVLTFRIASGIVQIAQDVLFVFEASRV